MSREVKTGLVSVAGTNFEIIKALVNGIKEAGGEENDVRRILSDKYAREKIQKILSSKIEVLWTGTVTIDHSISYEERVKNYGLVLRQLEGLYPIKCGDCVSVVKLKMLLFKKNILINEAIDETFAKKRLTPAGFEELIALGSQYPEVVFNYYGHQGHILLALGSSKYSEDAYFEVPSLSWSSAKPMLSTHQSVIKTCSITPLLFVESVNVSALH